MTSNPFDPRERQRRFGDPDLTRRILARTSGSACGRAEALLGGRWDARLDADDDRLLGEHLQRCGRCRALAAVLDRLPPVLSALAEREPGPSFTAAVLAATGTGIGADVSARTAAQMAAQSANGAAEGTGTSTRGPRRRSFAGVLESLALALQDRARQLWDRPRFALEAAWTASALASLLVIGPFAKEGVPEPIGRTVQAGAGAVPELIDRAENLAASIVAAGRDRTRAVIVTVQTRAADARRYIALVRTVVLGDEPPTEPGRSPETRDDDPEKR